MFEKIKEVGHGYLVIRGLAKIEPRKVGQVFQGRSVIIPSKRRSRNDWRSPSKRVLSMVAGWRLRTRISSFSKGGGGSEVPGEFEDTARPTPGEGQCPESTNVRERQQERVGGRRRGSHPVEPDLQGGMP